MVNDLFIKNNEDHKEKIMHVTKNSGRTEPFSLEKIKKFLDTFTYNLKNISIERIISSLKSHLHTNISTDKILITSIKIATDLISLEEPDYQYFASRLVSAKLRRDVYGKFSSFNLLSHVKTMEEQGLYEKDISSLYTAEEWDALNDYIDHKRDDNFTLAAIQQMQGKYLLRNRVTNVVYETPQILYMMMSAVLCSQKTCNKLQRTKELYDALSLFKISLPTPIMAGLRTATKQFSSCVLIDTDDSLDSINAAASSIVKYVSKRAGIGLNVGKIRAIHSPIRNGEAVHTGCIPFLKYFAAAVKSCSQGSIRSGAATLFYPLWHLEARELLVLKNNRGVEENRIRNLDYGVQINKTMYERLIRREKITLFSPSDVPGLHEAFCQDQALFEKLYVKYEKDTSIRKIEVPALEIFSTLALERSQTGRIYIQNIDHCNTHSSFNEAIAPIQTSNLCMEITLPTKATTNVLSEEGEIALCTLGAINLGEIGSLKDLEGMATMLVESLDFILDYQNYEIPAARISTKYRRPLGIGVTNLAYYFAKNNVKYDDGSANLLMHKTMEAFQYYLLKASNNLAKEKGRCPGFHETKYSQGLLPTDHYKTNVDSFSPNLLEMPWEELRADILKYGLRNSTLSAIMPCEASSLISNSTNGIEPPRGLLSVKSSKEGSLQQIVTGYEIYKDKYQTLWEMKSNKGYLQICAIIQKFIDQSISANTNYDPAKYKDNKVPLSEILSDILLSYQYGLKTLYYHNTRDGSHLSTECMACLV